MATKLDTYDFKTGPRSKYPWAQWLDGSIWALTAGEDYPATIRNFGLSASGAARKAGMKARVQRTETGYVIQAINGQA